MHLAVFLPNWVGDVVMATPALRALRAAHPDARITGVLRPYVAEVLEGTAFLDRTVCYDPKSRSREQRSWAVVRELRKSSIDTAILLTNGFRTAAMAWAAVRRAPGASSPQTLNKKWLESPSPGRIQLSFQ